VNELLEPRPPKVGLGTVRVVQHELQLVLSWPAQQLVAFETAPEVWCFTGTCCPANANELNEATARRVAARLAILVFMVLVFGCFSWVGAGQRVVLHPVKHRPSPKPFSFPRESRIPVQSSFIFRRRSALVMTETDDNDIAAPAIIGLSRVPVKG